MLLFSTQVCLCVYGFAQLRPKWLIAALTPQSIFIPCIFPGNLPADRGKGYLWVGVVVKHVPTILWAPGQELYCPLWHLFLIIQVRTYVRTNVRGNLFFRVSVLGVTRTDVQTYRRYWMVYVSTVLLPGGTAAVHVLFWHSMNLCV